MLGVSFCFLPCYSYPTFPLPRTALGRLGDMTGFDLHAEKGSQQFFRKKVTFAFLGNGKHSFEAGKIRNERSPFGTRELVSTGQSCFRCGNDHPLRGTENSQTTAQRYLADVSGGDQGMSSRKHQQTN